MIEDANAENHSLSLPLNGIERIQTTEKNHSSYLKHYCHEWQHHMVRNDCKQ